MMMFLLRHLGALRRTQAIYCLDGAYFEGLMLLSRAPLLNVSEKTIRRYSFHDRLVEAIAPRLKRAHPAFQIEMITHSQVRSAREKLGHERVVLRPWKIDADWYRFRQQPPATGSFFLCPGNIHRAESLLPSLLDQDASWRLIRASRSARDVRHPRVEARVNTPHAEYLKLLQTTRCAWLPIEPCDEPAGLTAAMEAIATGTPLLANASLGITELFDECDYPLPPLADLNTDSWAGAIRRLESLLHSDDFLCALARSREKLISRRGILPDGADWGEIAREMLDRQAAEPRLRAASQPLRA
jgi:glycosyltransferase involved in cell wall biosynthesis